MSPRNLPRHQMTLKLGHRCSASTLVCNPRFYEMLMGWPTGWTAVDSQATELSPWLRRMRSALLSLKR